MQQQNNLDYFKKTLVESPVIKRGEYNYFVHPLVDGVPRIEPDLLEKVTEEILNTANQGYEYIVTVEAMGIPLGSALSLKTGVPLVIIRKRQYFLEGEKQIDQSTGYSKGKLYINGLKKSMKVLLLDDVLSTGGTLRSVVIGLQEIGVEIVDVYILVDKSNTLEVLENELGISIKTMAKIDILDGKVVLLD